MGWVLWAQHREQRAQGEGALERAAERAEARAQPYLKGKGKLRGSRQKSEKFPCLGTETL